MSRGLAAALLAGAALAAAAHGDWAPEHGGLMNDGETSFELVAKGRQVALYVSDHGTPLPTHGARGSFTVTRGTRSLESPLRAGPGNRLDATLAEPLRPGDKVVSRVTMANGSIVVGRHVIGAGHAGLP